MLTVSEYIDEASTKGAPRPGIILAIRMCVLGMKLLEIDDLSAYHKKLVAIVETDRCLPDAVKLITGCRLANRTLKLKDWGKMAASFLDLTSGRAFRVAAREDVEPEALRTFQTLPREEALSQAYLAFVDRKLFEWRPILAKLSPEDVPGYRGKRLLCERCREGIGFRREVSVDGLTLCRACAGEAYWLPDVR
ncbi:MAG: TraR/DksA C4-type zinc finger protein [Acidobacteriota bacterium]|nr:TraR/DksA C4-type zinc finger protein [Acidobacteriota bacterium]